MSNLYNAHFELFFQSIQIARDLMQVIVYLRIFLLTITYSFHCDDLVEKQEIKQCEWQWISFSNAL
jgi:hypothetical protein